ncbi:GGDEF domain-containing response regulator [Lusitaniella coriacea LEGE 07157]|uniref:GGDEF domain-containing response regulator n=1 Tax=Lusitaniella coriacea LEGE 07157 TaxID=945747 RepID=A0A8J7E0M2_9CYAN|nr:GGDEF domain-containing response regulator [Lusitaniella coriacea]MBE9118306.1 GGDEF domain-containing response regulator [Lusitaniella coriacea LEGE 07157]
MRKILVIEENEAIRLNWVNWLEENDYRAIAAENGALGVECVFQEKPDAILCSATLAQMDDYDVLNGLRQNSQTVSIPFIILSADVTVQQWREAMDRGADDYLSQAVESEQLLKTVAIHLKKTETIRQQYETKIERLRYYDPLTELPNRLLLRDRFRTLLQTNSLTSNKERAARNLAPVLLPILCLGLDRLDRVRDTLGYIYGDRLLQAVAHRLKENLGQDILLAYLNADEFAIVLEPVEHKRVIGDVLEDIQEQFSQHFLLKKREVFMTASMGVALYPRDGRTMEKLLRNAKKAMNEARKQGGNGAEFYTAVFNIGASNTFVLEAEFRRAWENQELEVYYQPKVSLTNGEIVGCEALLRWQHPERGRVSPDKFMSIAEETGLIDPIGEWVVKTAGQQVLSWHKAGWKDLRLAINLSSRQFSQINLRQRLAKILAAIPLGFQYVELEFTEPSLIQNPAIATQRLNAFKALGMQIVIDDFGTGYSSLNYLLRFPFDALKIDQCFVQNLVDNPTNQAITKAIIQMAHGLNLKVTAEGVETEDELEFFCEHQCDEIQGYLFSPPLSAREFTKLLQSKKRLY